MVMQSFRASFATLIVFTLILGFVYPGVIVGISQAFFKDQAECSLIRAADHKIVGSSLIGQSFSDPKYFWGRVSATGPVPYNAAASSGSNLGSAAPNLEAAVKARIEALRAADPANKARIPVDLVTASGSGLDPHISLAAAEYQMGRVARVRGIKVDDVRKILLENTEQPQFGVLGQSRVNVLKLNRQLDGISEK